MKNELDTASKELRGKRLYHIRKNLLKMSRREFSERHSDLKITQAALNNWEEARFSGIKEKHVDLILSVLEREKIICDRNWLLYGIGESPRFGTILDIQKNFRVKENDFILKELRLFREFYIDSVDAIVKDEGLSPTFFPSDYVAGVRYAGEQIMKAIGFLSITQTQDGLILIRKVERGSLSDCFNLISTNKHYAAGDANLINIKLFSAAPIIFWRRLLSEIK